MNPFSDALSFFARAEISLYIFWLLMLTIAIEFLILRADTLQRSGTRRWTWTATVLVLGLLAFVFWLPDVSPPLGGPTRYVYWICLLAAIVIAAVNLRRSPEQRTGGVRWLWVLRLLIAALPAYLLGFTNKQAGAIYVFWLLLLGGIYIGLYNLRYDSEERTPAHAWMWIARLLIGGLWWQQTLWKMPPTYTDNPDGVSGGLHFWVAEMVRNAAFSWHSAFVEKVIQPNFNFFAAQVYAGEVFISVSLLLGFFGRVGGAAGALMALNLWLGLYRHPAEWPWTYFFLIIIQITFAVMNGGRSLGLDAIMLRNLRAKESVTLSSRVLAWLT
jgi:uncharacterized membrane protein YphA (DoxX/SURF4 family)